MPAHRNTAEQFWAKLDKSGECWLYTGTLASTGYGKVGYQRRKLSSHRLAYELAYGPIPDGLLVCHHCDVRACCRPDHLFLGTYADNAHDAVAKGRFAFNLPTEKMSGEQNGFAKLTADTVREIRHQAMLGMNYSALGRRFGISKGQARNIVLRLCWDHID